MKYLAGLLRIQYVFFYPETGDIVLAGPAEGFAEDPVGRIRGLTSGRPVLQLQDLVTAMRAYPPAGNKLNVIGVSIDPTPEGLERLRQTLASIGRTIRPGDDVRLAATLREALGLQTVSVQGISPKSHFAQVLVEADYRMKLIGIGLEQPPREDSELRRSGGCRAACPATRCSAGISSPTTSACASPRTDSAWSWKAGA